MQVDSILMVSNSITAGLTVTLTLLGKFLFDWRLNRNGNNKHSNDINDIKNRVDWIKDSETSQDTKMQLVADRSLETLIVLKEIKSVLEKNGDKLDKLNK